MVNIRQILQHRERQRYRKYRNRYRHRYREREIDRKTERQTETETERFLKIYIYAYTTAGGDGDLNGVPSRLADVLQVERPVPGLTLC